MRCWSESDASQLAWIPENIREMWMPGCIRRLGLSLFKLSALRVLSAEAGCPDRRMVCNVSDVTTGFCTIQPARQADPPCSSMLRVWTL